jgi:ketosteroid isomerase-like protein
MNPQDVLEAYRRAVDAKDADAFVALYDPAVRVFDLWERWSYDGAEAWRGMAAGWFASLDDARVAVTFDDVQTIVGRDITVVHAFATYRNVAPDGTSPRAMSNRLTWTLVKSGDGWRIVHEHTSAPVDPATGQALLQRGSP